MREIVSSEFQKHFGQLPSIITRAPGRANLIGEHVDYNDGFVLPMAIDRNIWVAANPRDDNILRAHSITFEETITLTTDQLNDKTMPHWTHYLRGVWYLLGERGLMPPGVDIAIGGDVPVASGLSSSAAIEIALIELALALTQQHWSQAEKALFGVEVEHKFTGMPSGVMDQMASAASQAGHALLIDCRSLETTPVHIPNGVSVVVMDTAKPRQLVDSAYAERRRQCEEAATILKVKALRDATLSMVNKFQAELGDVRFRRARHIVTENQRVLDFIGAAEKTDLHSAGDLMNQSHYSLRDDYEVSCRELDIITEIARQQDGCYGARMTGAGFGGCGVALVKREDVDSFINTVAEKYQQQTNLTPRLWEFKPAAGSEVVVSP